MITAQLRQVWRDICKWHRRMCFRMGLWATTYRARQKLSTRPRLRVLVDNSVIAHGRIYSSFWFDTGKSTWGKHTVNTGYAGPGLPHSPDNDKRIYDQLSYLPEIADVAKRGYLELLTSFELLNEKTHQPVGRYSEYSYFDYNLFGALKMDCIDCDEIDNFDWQELPQDRVRRHTGQPFRAIVKLIGEKNNVDAWHIHTVHKYDLDYFLHMDFSLDEEVRKNREKSPISELRSKIVMPSNLAEILGIDAIDIGLVPPGD